MRPDPEALCVCGHLGALHGRYGHGPSCKYGRTPPLEQAEDAAVAAALMGEPFDPQTFQPTPACSCWSFRKAKPKRKPPGRPRKGPLP